MKKGRRVELRNLGITRGAMIVLGLEIGLSLVWLMSSLDARQTLAEWMIATPANVFEHGRVWTLVTSPLVQPSFVGLLLHGVVLWMFVPTLERFWGTPRFYRFVLITSLAGTVFGTLAGFVLGTNFAITSLDPFIYASIVAFGIVYAKQPVQFFGVLPLTGRQLMFGFMGFLVLYIGLQQYWETGAAFASAMGAAALITSKGWNPGLAWKRWRIARARAKLTVMQGGQGGPPKKRDEKWLN